MPTLLKPDGFFTHDPVEKTTIFADMLDRKQSNEKLTMPQTCFPESILTGLAFQSRERKNLLLDLDAHGGAFHDGIFLISQESC